MKAVLILTGLIVASAFPATAQTWRQSQPPYAAYPGGAAAAIADQHRYETERLRSQAQANATLARQQALETRIERQRIEAARQRLDSPATAPRPLYSPEQERALRQGAAERRAQTAQGVAQIDAWLDRPN